MEGLSCGMLHERWCFTAVFPLFFYFAFLSFMFVSFSFCFGTFSFILHVYNIDSVLIPISFNREHIAESKTNIDLNQFSFLLSKANRKVQSESKMLFL